MTREGRMHAPAKLNLSLAVGGVRPDGFHEIHSLIHGVDFGDEIHVEASPGQSRISVLGNPTVRESDDLCLKAAFAFLRMARLELDIVIRVTKRIPAGGGLGGGSSDAAAVFRVLSCLYPEAISTTTLETLSAELGSDIPSFFHMPAAIAGGRGEVVRSCDSAGKYPVLIVDSGVAVSTADAYRLLDRSRPRSRDIFSIDDQEIASKLKTSPESWGFENDFSAVIGGAYPAVRRSIDLMRESGALYANLSGSGGCVYGVFDSVRSASRAADGFSGGRYWITRLLATANTPVLQ
jgi:4-diphosphocytidyl-2-C-methyl-D-erythritol kinase